MRLLLGLLFSALAVARDATTESQEKKQTTVAPKGPLPTESPIKMTTALTTQAPAPHYNGTYLVVAPAVIRPGLPYAVSVNILQSEDDSNTILLEIRNPDNETLAVASVLNVKKGEPRTVTIPGISPEVLVSDVDYTVWVKGETSRGKQLFVDSKSIRFDQKSMSTFIQTDKGIYKPGQTVMFRVVNVSPELLPFNGTVSIQILDPNQNIIKQENDKKLTKGVYSGQLALASQPPLGDWTIEATPEGGQKTSKTFTVDEYVLPKFEVTVTPPPFMTNDQDLAVLISAMYTYGKGVAGSCEVTLELPYAWEGDNKTRIERTVTLSTSGEATVTFSNKELHDHDLINEWGGYIHIIATVSEDLTGVQRNGTADVQSYQYGVKLDLQKHGDSYKPGLPYTILVALKQQDDTPIKANLPRDVQITTTYNYPIPWWDETSKLDQRSQIVTLDSDGTYVLTILPPQNSTSLSVQALYDPKGNGNFTWELISGDAYSEAYKSPSNSFLQVLPVSDANIPAGRDVSFTVQATDKLAFITYQVMSRGAMLLSKEIALNSENTTITFPTTTEMAPKSRLIVYSVHGDTNEILVDASDFNVAGLFRNNVTLSLDKQEAEPGNPVSLTVQADPHSFVGLMAVDQSVLLLKAGNDITPQIVEDDIAGYDTTGYSGGCCFPIFEGRRKRSLWFPWWGIGGQDAASVFQNAGLVVLTDAYLYRRPFFIVSTPSPVFGEPEDGHRPHAHVPVPAPLPQAAAQTSGGGGASAAPRLRTLFPETWLWVDQEAGSDGQVVYNTTAPDTITSWITSAFAVSDETGLGVAPTTQKLKVFRPFFVRLELPYSVKRGEKFALQVLVFNYMETEQEVTVTLKHDKNSGFDFLKKDGTLYNSSSPSSNYNIRKTSVPGGGASKAVYFPIVPNTLGNVQLQVTGISAAAGDAVRQPLLVEPEGYRVDRNVPLVVSVNGSTFHENVTLSWPTEYVEGSRTATMDVIGDIMGPVLSNVDDLIRMPYGCGEQNMLFFVPDIVVMEYLNATGRVDPTLAAKAKQYMEAGYQRELTYKRSDNSFSAFGNSDTNGSTWLTAFVVRSFSQAKPYIFIDQKILDSSIEFLNNQQVDSGAFAEHGAIIHKDMQGGATEGGLGLTAYVTVALLENNVTNQKALTYLENQLDSIGNDSYTLAVVTYALFLADSPRKLNAMVALQQLKITGSDGSVHWASTKGDNSQPTNDWYFFQSRPVDVETTAYVLLSTMLEGETEKGLPIVRWLTAQRNSLGGFSSTQDTVVALQALAAYSKVVYSPNTEDSIIITVTDGSKSHKFTVNNQNSLVLQSYELPNLNAPISLTATGKGTAFVQIAYSYYRKTLNSDSPFYCSIKTKELRGGSRLELDMCCNYTRTGKSNMAVAEIDTLSGYQYDEADNSLTDIPGIQRKEIDKGDTQINIYFDPIGADPVCFSLVSDLVFQVAGQRPAQIVLYDYYNPEDQLKATYTAPSNSSLDKSCLDCWA